VSRGAVSDQTAVVEAHLRASPRLMTVLETARALDLPDWLMFSGAIYQTVWNGLTGRDPDYGIKDYDLGYFDPDVSWDAEDAVIRRARNAYAPPLDGLVEVRNQARVHLWFEARFGQPYTPLANTAQALERFASPTFAIGARLEADGGMMLATPFGLDDLLAMRIAPNPSRDPGEGFVRAAASAKARWPEVEVVQP
jgi:hypothetical protein